MYISHEHDIDVFVKDNDEPLDLKSVFTVALSGKIKGSVKYTLERCATSSAASRRTQLMASFTT